MGFCVYSATRWQYSMACDHRIVLSRSHFVRKIMIKMANLGEIQDCNQDGNQDGDQYDNQYGDKDGNQDGNQDGDKDGN